MKSYIVKMPILFTPRSVTLVAENVMELEEIVDGLCCMNAEKHEDLIYTLKQIIKETKNG